VNDDDRLAQYLSGRAESIALAPGDVRDITVRVMRRRRSRRTFSAAAAVAVLALGAVVLLSRSPSHQSVTVAGTGDAEPSRAPLTWSAVDVPEGLGWSIETVNAGSGTLFSLSTAPGVVPSGAITDARQVLYRSTDGRTWSTIALPDGLSPTALASSPGHLYAVGTAPGGGTTVDFAVASSTDDGNTWSQAHMPQPEAELKARFPNEVQISAPVIASGPQGIVAAISVTAMPNIQALLPAATMAAGWNVTAAGVDIYAPCASDMQSISSSYGPPPTNTVDCPKDQQHPPIEKSYTWDELGVDPALRALIGGQVHLYRSQDGSTFEEVAAPGVDGYVANLSASGDGYRMLTSGMLAPGGLRPYYSADGATWTATDDAGFDGWVIASGLLQGQPAVLLESMNGVELLTARSGGGWLHPVAVSGGLDTPKDGGKPLGLQAAVIGPLGVAAVFSNGDQTFISESADGRHYTTHALRDIGGDGSWYAAGISMSADAVVVRLVPAPAPGSDPSTSPVPGPQRLLVGTIS
jgi:hypothetical protein